MGNKMTGGKQNSFLVGTLNFSGICLSPFEYHDCSVQKDFMSAKLEEVMKAFKDQKTGGFKYKNEDFSWEIGKIDQIIQQARYAPVYNKNACVQDGKLVNREEFKVLWKKAYDAAYKSSEKEFGDKVPTQEQIIQVMDFDWICYETFVNVVYNQTPKAKFDMQRVKQMPAKHYQEFMEEWHSKSYLSNDKKMERVVKLLEKWNFDILFMQEAKVQNEKSWSKMVNKGYEVVESQKTSSIIVFRKSRFPTQSKQDKQFENKYQEKFYFNDDSIMTKRGKYLLVSGHLSSKKKKYQEQTPQMFEVLTQILGTETKDKSQDEKLHLIMGLDSNHFLNPKQYSNFNIIPQVQTDATSIKKRTAIQLQTQKKNLIVMETKDQIVSDLRIVQSHVVMINGDQTSDKTYLPSEEHPFDHFLVCAEIIINDSVEEQLKSLKEEKKKE